MNQNLIYYPCFFLLLLTAIVLSKMFITRLKAIKTKAVDVKYFKTYNSYDERLPNEMVQAARNFTNLFEVPTLFYMVCLFGLVTQNVDKAFLVLAWIYVALRYIHSLVHLTSNKIMPRMGAYATSWLVLLIMAFMLMSKI